jgi:hypothetical protein
LSGILSDLEIPIQGVIDLLFREPQLTETMTYRLYRGQSAEGEDRFEDFSIVAIPDRKAYRTAALPKRLQAQIGGRNFIIREADLPVHITVRDLSANDRIVDGESEFQVVELDKTLGFVIHVLTRGE